MQFASGRFLRHFIQGTREVPGFSSEVIQDLLQRGAAVEVLDLKEAPDILTQARIAIQPMWLAGRLGGRLCHDVFQVAACTSDLEAPCADSTRFRNVCWEVLTADELSRFSTKLIDIADGPKATCMRQRFSEQLAVICSAVSSLAEVKAAWRHSKVCESLKCE